MMPPDPAKDFLQIDVPGSVVFVGVVTSVRQADGTTRGGNQDIMFRPTKVLRGTFNGSSPVRGFVTANPSGAPCGDLFDFTASPGEEWLIFGTIRDGVVYPDKASSHQVKNAAVPAHVLGLIRQWPGSTWTKLRVLNDPEPVYPPEALKSHHEGWGDVQITVAPSGRVIRTHVEQGFSRYPELYEAARRTARAMTFEPFEATGHLKNRRMTRSYFFVLPGTRMQVPARLPAPYAADAVAVP
jgi:TonB family protein